MKPKAIVALLGLPLIAACAPEIEATIRVTEVEGVVESGQSKSVPAILRVPQGSEDGCNEGLDKLIENLATLAPVSGKGRCIEEDGDTLAEIETEMVIASPDSGYDVRNLFVLTATPTDPEALTFELSLALTQPLEDIVKVLATDSDQLQVDFDPAKFIFTLTNDAGWSVDIRGQTVFFDGRPALPEMIPPTVPPNSSVEITFSDVASVYAEEANPYHFATLYLPP